MTDVNTFLTVVKQSYVMFSIVARYSRIKSCRIVKFGKCSVLSRKVAVSSVVGSRRVWSQCIVSSSAVESLGQVTSSKVTSCLVAMSCPIPLRSVWSHCRVQCRSILFRRIVSFGLALVWFCRRVKYRAVALSKVARYRCIRSCCITCRSVAVSGTGSSCIVAV